LIGADEHLLTLKWAASDNHTAVAVLLVSHGAKLEARGSAGRTALSWAAGNGHVDVLSCLLDKGALTPRHATQKEARPCGALWVEVTAWLCSGCWITASMPEASATTGARRGRDTMSS